MKHNTKILVDESGFEILVGYDYEIEQGYYAEKDNPATWVEETISTELTSVEIVIIGRGIDILPLLTKKQINYITDKLTYDKS